MDYRSDIYDDIFKRKVAEHFPLLFDDFGPLAWLIIKAQCWQESSFNSKAISPAGAIGLMQLMPSTAQYLRIDDPFDPEKSIDGGVRYLAEQYSKLREIPHKTDRIKAALASYNGGRGYINSALALGRFVEGLPTGFSKWQSVGKPVGFWQTWPVISTLLGHEQCTSGGKRPDYEQMINYVDRIELVLSDLFIIQGIKGE
jgi:membrane-bound lytic murein transglycosylase MltF